MKTEAEPKTIAAEIITRARAVAFNEFMDAMGKVLPDGPVGASVWMFQATWREVGEDDATTDEQLSKKVDRRLRTQIGRAVAAAIATSDTEREAIVENVLAAVLSSDEIAQQPDAGTASGEFQGIRTQLFEAKAVVHCVKRSLLADEYAAEEIVDTTRLQNALEVAARMIDGAASRLEPFEEGRSHA